MPDIEITPEVSIGNLRRFYCLGNKGKPLRKKGCNTMNRTLLIGLTTTFCLGLLLTNPLWGGLVLHLDASDSSTIEDSSGNNPGDGSFDSSGVSTWNDKSGQGNHATQSTPENMPSWVGAGGPGGLDILRFEEEYMSLPTVSQGTSGLTAFIVVKQFQQDAEQNFDTWLGTTADGDIFINTRPVEPVWNDGGAFGTNGEEGRFEGDTHVLHLLTSKYQASDGAITHLYNGGNQVACVAGGADCLNPGQTLSFDQVARYHNAAASKGDLAEIQFFDEHLSAAAENSIGFALAEKWGLNTAYTPEPSSCMLLGLGMLFGTWTRGRRFQPRR